MKKGNGSREKSPFSVVDVYPPFLTDEEFNQAFDQAVEALAKLDQHQRGRREITVKVNHSDPIQLVLAGDMHIGSLATNYRLTEELKEYVLRNQNVILMLLGDEIEGFKQQYASTNTAQSVPGLQNHLDKFYLSFFQPLAEAGRIAGVVSGYWGHNGWTEDQTTLNMGRLLTRHHPNIPTLANGGLLKIRFKNRTEVKVRVQHNPPGKSKFDPVYGLREAAQKHNPRTVPAVFTSGHIHTASTFSENYPRSRRTVHMVQAGTAKSSTPGMNRDRFGERLAFDLADPYTQGVIINPPKGRRGSKSPEVQYAHISAEQGALVLAALTWLNRTEKEGTTQERIEEIYNAYPGPEFTYHPARSRVSESPGAQLRGLRRKLGRNDEDHLRHGDIRPLYKQVAYDIRTQLPVTIHPVANVRLGSFHETAKELPVEAFMKEVAQDKYAFALYLRSILDLEAAKSPRRMDILQRYIDLVKVMDGRVLGVLLDSSLGHKRWLRAVGELHEQRGLAAGSYLSAEADAKLIHHMSTIHLAVGRGSGFNGKAEYPIQVADRLERHGSYTSMRGILRMFQLHSDDPAAMVGGHMPTSGVGQVFKRDNTFIDNPVMLAPGTWSVFSPTSTSRGKGAEPGQAIIMMPGTGRRDAMMIPTGSADMTQLLSKAVTLLEGSKLLGHHAEEKNR